MAISGIVHYTKGYLPTFYCLPKPLFLYGSMALLSYMAATIYMCMAVTLQYVCVFFLFILDVKFDGYASRGHTGGKSNMISHPPSFCGAYLSFSREKGSAVPFPRRPRSRILCTNDLIVSLNIKYSECDF